MNPQEYTIKSRFGTIAVKQWGDPSKPAIVALHGWLDNAASFDLLAPHLAKSFCIQAVDMIGHGHSAHLPEAILPHFIDQIWVLDEILNHLGGPRKIVMGHSMGGAIALLHAAVTGRVEKLVCIEALGPLTAKEGDTLERLQSFLLKWKNLAGKRVPTYDSIEEAATARTRAADISLEAAKIIATRGTKLSSDGKTVTWRTDPRLTLPTPVRMTPGQIVNVMQGLKIPMLLVTGARGFRTVMPEFLAAKDLIANLTHKDLPGGHHLHMETPEPVARAICEFLN